MTPLRVLAVDHTAGIRPFRKRFEALAALPGIDLTVLAPERWIENYHEVLADPDGGRGFRFLRGAVGWPGYENRAFFRRGLGPAIRKARPHVLHLWEEPFSVIALQALSLAALWAPRAVPLFFSADNLNRDLRYPYRPSAFYARVERYSHRRCAAATVLSTEVAEVLRAKGFTKPIEVIPLGLDPADFPAGRRASRDEVVARFGLEPPIVGFAGRLLPVKGVDLLPRAVASMGSARTSLVIVGEGPERQALESLAGELGILDRTRFLPLVSHETMPFVLAAMDVLVLPSRTLPKQKEQFGRVLIEAMAAGCVTIGSSSGGIPEVLGNAGLVFEEERVDRLTDALRTALLEPGTATRLREAGRARVTERYTWEAIARRIVDFYGRIGCSPGSFA